MIMGFVIWSIVSAIMLGIGIWSYRSEKPVGFITVFLGTIAISIGLMVGYVIIEKKNR